MNRDHQNWQAVPSASINWQDQTPSSTDFNDIYYSREHGLAESRHVFLQQNRIPERFQSHCDDSFCVVETGFGSGLNFLATWQAWHNYQAAKPRLHFISIEQYPLTKTDLRKALANWPELADFSNALIAQYPAPLPGVHRLVFADGEVTLDLYYEEVLDALTELSQNPTPIANAWYLDGFSPDKNSAMWRDAVFIKMSLCSKDDATVGTFTAAGFVRRGLAGAGFSMEKTPGFGRKREQLRGDFLHRPAKPAPGFTPWHHLVSDAKPTRCIVLGAGLAGASAAAALAERGVCVTVLEKNTVASAASGNQQGILYTRLSLKHSPLQDFALHSFGFAVRHYQRLFAQHQLEPERDGQLCGSFHPQHDNGFLDQLAPRLATLPEIAQVLSAQQASAILGVEQTQAGIFFPLSGWLNPQAVCRALLDHPLIHLQEHCGALSLSNVNKQWNLYDDKQQMIASAGHVVVATGNGAAQEPWLSWLPLRAIRGQVSHIPAQSLPPIHSALCAKGYIAPARAGVHCIGASFDIDDTDLTLRKSDHRANLDKLAAAIPAWQDSINALNPRQLEGRAALRCTSPDYLPIVGAVPDRTAFLHDYGALRKNARTAINRPSSYLPGLYISTAHGSRGLTSTPLAGQLLASMICGEPLPLPGYLQQALAPGRFIMRDLARNRA